jgi:hypothetical protein
MRLVIFPLLGPLIGSVTFHLLAWATATAPYSLWPNLSVFLAGYLLGFFPALVTGIFDWFLSTKILGWWRVPATACAGYVLSALMVFCWYSPPYIDLRDVVLIGCFGVLPAAVCSWLSREEPGRR